MGDTLRFYHHKDKIVESALPADVTVLDYLRQRRHCTGSKEGCASGDCGACTVVVARVNAAASQLEYRAVNSCIAYVGTLHCSQLITVENLALGQQLHPVQNAMVEAHGSQCGFCTPGFVMSMFALWKQDATEHFTELDKRHEIDQALGGNLCRCTGYRPIIDAAGKLLAMRDREDHFSRDHDITVKNLCDIGSTTREISGEQSADATPAEGFYAPDNLTTLCRLRAELPNARLLAGGTDLALLSTQQLQPLPALISIKSVPELDYFSIGEDRIRLGAGLSLLCLETLLGTRIEAVQKLLQRFGSRQVRAAATVGGNVANASPIGDLPPVFLALDATVVLRSMEQQRELPLEDFFLGYRQTELRDNEVLSELSFPWAEGANGDGGKLFVYKISKRQDDDISAVCAAFFLKTSGSRVSVFRAAFGGMAAIPARAHALEKVVTGTTLDDATLQKGAAAIDEQFSPLSDVRASAGYRNAVAGNLLQRLARDVATADHH